MLSAGQGFVAWQRAWMVDFNAANLATLVSPAASLLLTSPAAPSIVRPAGHLRTGQVLVHIATPAPDTGGEGAGGAGTQVTGGPALVRS